MPVAERAHLLFLRGKIVRSITTTVLLELLPTTKVEGRCLPEDLAISVWRIFNILQRLRTVTLPSDGLESYQDTSSIGPFDMTLKIIIPPG